MSTRGHLRLVYCARRARLEQLAAVAFDALEREQADIARELAEVKRTAVGRRCLGLLRRQRELEAKAAALRDDAAALGLESAERATASS